MKLAPVPRYVVLSDFEEYVEGWETTDAKAIERLLARAERYIDILGAGQEIKGADAVQCIEITYTKPPTGGSFQVQFTVNGTSYTSLPIPYNATYRDVINSFDGASGFQGSVQSYPGPPAPFVNSGPLPAVPIIFAFIGFAGATPIPASSVVNDSLTGGEGVAVAVKQVCPGSGWSSKFNPSRLLAYGQLEALKRAVCAQAEYMYTMGPRFFIEPQFSQVKGPDFTTTGKRPQISPKARRELALAGLTVSMARSRP